MTHIQNTVLACFARYLFSFMKREKMFIVNIDKAYR